MKMGPIRNENLRSRSNRFGPNYAEKRKVSYLSKYVLKRLVYIVLVFFVV